jgi:nitrilase
VGCGNALTVDDIPDDFPDKAGLYPESEEWINPGDSVVIAPGGEVIAGPLRKQQGVLYAEVDVKRVGIARRTFDVAGHYSRPDIFSLHVNTRVQKPVEFE